MSKKFIGLMIFVLLLTGMMSFTGCGNTEEKITKEYNVTLYFANNEYVQPGDESFEHMVVVKDYKLESEEGNQYMVLVDSALRNGAEGVEGADTLISDKIVFNEVSVDGGVATVDLAGATLNGGSLEESYLISQIVDSLIASFDEIGSVQFLVDGEKSESLMGHFDVRAPFTEGVTN
ncbi:MAG: GerMN domain-containing protein [Peptostreptococcaceae bacterium]|nr:GerMN domain-containing protein [Peptostreptococcaceae bacterium]